MRSDFSASLAQLTAEKGLQKDELIEMVEAAMVSAYKKDFAGNEEKNIVVRMEPQTGAPTRLRGLRRRRGASRTPTSS